MPLYEYQCDACGSVFEVRQKFSDEPLAVHESCGGAVRRLLSVPSLQFKGSGWYITDYGRSSGGSGNGESKGSGESNKGSGESSSKSETKDTKKSDTSSSSSTTTSSSTDKKS